MSNENELTMNYYIFFKEMLPWFITLSVAIGSNFITWRLAKKNIKKDIIYTDKKEKFNELTNELGMFISNIWVIWTLVCDVPSQDYANKFLKLASKKIKKSQKKARICHDSCVFILHKIIFLSATSQNSSEYEKVIEQFHKVLSLSVDIHSDKISEITIGLSLEEQENMQKNIDTEFSKGYGLAVETAKNLLELEYVTLDNSL